MKDDIGLLWHYRIEHVSKGYSEKAKSCIKELEKVRFTNTITDCEVCTRAKLVKQPCNTKRYRYDAPFELIHTDTIGPITPCSYKFGGRYIVTLCVNKTSVHIAFRKMLENARAIYNKEVKISLLRLDNGTKYRTENMKDLIKREKIILENTPPHNSDLNETAERFNRELQEEIRC